MTPGPGGDFDLNEEVEYVRRQRADRQRQMRDAPGRAAADPNLDDDLKRTVTVLRAPVDDDFVLPSHFGKTMTPGRLRDLRDVLSELREYCDDLAGMTDMEALIVCNGDAAALLLRDTLTDIMLGHASDRMGRPSVKDRSAFGKWVRLMREFGWWLGEFTCRAGTGHNAVLGGVYAHVAWVMYKATWGGGVYCDHVTAQLYLDGIEEHLREFATEVLYIFDWDTEGATAVAMSRYPNADIVEGEAEEVRRELGVVGDDLREMKALLLRNYRPEERLVTLPDGNVAMWTWEIGHRLGSVQIAPTAEGVVNALGPASGAIYVCFDFDGRVIEPRLPWMDLGEQALRWALGVLRPIRERLLADWMVAERRRPADDAPRDSITDAEVVATACEALAEPEGDEPADVGRRRGTRHRVPAVREHTLLRLMERHFGCEVQSSKGSEVTVYRPGAKKFTLPGKRRGQHMPAFMIIHMLKHLDIAPNEFAAVVTKRR